MPRQLKEPCLGTTYVACSQSQRAMTRLHWWPFFLMKENPTASGCIIGATLGNAPSWPVWVPFWPVYNPVGDTYAATAWQLAVKSFSQFLSQQRPVPAERSRLAYCWLTCRRWLYLQPPSDLAFTSHRLWASSDKLDPNWPPCRVCPPGPWISDTVVPHQSSSHGWWDMHGWCCISHQHWAAWVDAVYTFLMW